MQQRVIDALREIDELPESIPDAHIAKVYAGTLRSQRVELTFAFADLQREFVASMPAWLRRFFSKV